MTGVINANSGRLAGIVTLSPYIGVTRAHARNVVIRRTHEHPCKPVIRTGGFQANEWGRCAQRAGLVPAGWVKRQICRVLSDRQRGAAGSGLGVDFRTAEKWFPGAAASVRAPQDYPDTTPASAAVRSDGNRAADLTKPNILAVPQ